MDKQLKMQHKEQKQGFLFLYALSQELKDRAKAEGFDVLDFIPQLSKFYQVRELKRNTIVDAFAVTNQFKYIIILAHHNKDNSLVLSDESHLSMSHLINLLPDDLQESVLDFAICKSDSIADIIKAKTHCEHVLSTKGYTDLKPRFLTYLFLPGYMKAHPETDDYLKAYSSCLNELKQKVGKKNLRPSTTKLGDSTESSNDSINTSVYSPNHVSRGYNFIIQVFLNYDSEKGIVYDIAIGRDHETKPHPISDSLKGIQKGDKVEVKLSMQDVKYNLTNLIKVCDKECTYSETFIISDKFVEKEFNVMVCEEYQYEEFWAVVEFIKDGKSIIKPNRYKISIKQESSQKNINAILLDAMEGHKDFSGAPIMTGTEMAHGVNSKEEVNHRDEKMTLFVHPELNENEGWLIHDSIKRLVKCQTLQDILNYLLDLKHNKKVLLPMSTKIAYDELVRMGMPNGEGFSEKKFYKYYLDNCYKK